MSAYWDDGIRREELVRVALGQRPADLVIRGGTLVNVHTGEIYPADVAVAGTRIAAVGDVERCLGEDTRVVDAEGRYLVPGFIDCHLHIGASSLVISELARLVVPFGTAAIVTDFYEPATMRGTEAMRIFLDEAARTPLKVYLSPFSIIVAGEGSGGVATREELEETLAWPETVELREWNVSSELPGSSDQALGELARSLGLRLCGHLPPMPDPALQGSVAAGVHSDHEATSAQDALERARLGVAVQMRWASGVRRHLKDILRAITEHRCDSRLFMFSTDEEDVDDLADLGHIDHRVRTAVSLGVAPVDAVRMGSLNAATYFGVTGDLGSVTPGRLAFVNLVDDLAELRVSKVVAGSQVVGEDGRYVGASPAASTYPASYRNTINVGRRLEAADFRVAAAPDATRITVRVIAVDDPGERYGERLVELRAGGGEALVDTAQDVVKIAVVERHRATGKIGVGFLHGFGLARGAFGSAFQPGAVDIGLVGASDADMALAANRIAELRGGFVAALDGRVLAEVALPVLGFLSAAPAEEVVAAFREVRSAIAERLGCDVPGLYTALGFLCLPVGEGLHITADGLVRVEVVDGGLVHTAVSTVASEER